jgi:hypothetical protein
LKIDRRADRTAQKIRHVHRQPVDVRGLRIESLAPGECQKAMGQRRGAGRPCLRHLEILADLLVTTFPQALRDQLEAARHAGEQIVEIVCQASGELADGFHLLGLAQLLLCQFALAGAFFHLLLKRFRQSGQRGLGETPFDRRLRAIGHVAHEGQLGRYPFARVTMIQIKKTNENAAIEQGHIEHRPSVNGLQRWRCRLGARILARVGNDDRLASLEVLYVGAVITKS